MMNDTVREELQTKIMPGVPPRIEARPMAMPVSQAVLTRPTPKPQPIAKPQVTSDLIAPKTSPTLVEFQTKSASLPDWRLQLQNAVQQRKGGGQNSLAATATSFPTNGGAALKAEIVPQSVPVIEPQITDPRVASAMRRIAESRKAFAEPEVPKKMTPPRPAPARSFPFDVVTPNGRGTATAASPARVAASSVALSKPRLVVPQPVKRDTNKLPPIVETIDRVEEIKEPIAAPLIAVAEQIVARAESEAMPTEFGEIKRIRIRAENAEIVDIEAQDGYEDEIDDLAPFSMRFGAGLFDLIIGAFTAMVLLLPFALAGAKWTTASGIMTFAATWAIVSFLYMTVGVGFFGKTMGMRLFSLEIVDALENEYPTLHQAAISSSMYILSLLCAGAGFITALFNEERRAIHDLLSGTIVVREF